MLAGLLFAHHDAEDRPDRLIATLPFAGSTLIEHQARQLVAAGASQLIVVAQRLPPELLGALSRIARPGVAVDAVRTAGEAAAKLHPLARVLMLADGLVATDAAVLAMAREGGDALLVIEGEQAGRDFERLGGRMAWAGIARLQPPRVDAVAALPRDYDMQAALVRVLEEAGAAHLQMTGDPARYGHGLARGEAALMERGRRVLASFFAGRRNWFERWIVAQVAGWVLPPLVSRGMSGAAVGVGVAILGLPGAALAVEAHGAAGALLAFAGALLATIGSTLASLRGEERATRALSATAIGLPLMVALLIGWATSRAAGDSGALVAAVGLVLFAILGERAAAQRESWWGGPAAYLLPVIAGAMLRQPGWGLGVAALYAAATLAAAVERLRPARAT